jgi:hypothetical protein
MDWRYKAYVQSLLSSVPAGERLHYLLQKRVTRTIPENDGGFRNRVRSAIHHLELVSPHLPRPPENATFYEFGAGWTLLGPLTYYAVGVNRQIVVDVRRLSRPELVIQSVERLRRLADPTLPRSHRFPTFHPRELTTELRSECGVDYRAPCDARATGLPSGLVDCITSTATLEHVPAEDIPALLRECFRLLKCGGVMSHFIDYTDHYANFAPQLSRFNYLQYEDRQWKRFSPSLHFQNRLRHRDYVELFRAAGFAIVAEHAKAPREADLRDIARLRVAERFKAYSGEELAIRNAFIVSRKP